MLRGLTSRTVAGCMVGGVVLAGLTLATGGGTVRATAKPPTTDTLRQGLLQLPLAFEKNAGQLDARVRYLARGSGYALFLTSDEAVLRLRKPTRGEAPAGDTTVRMRLAGAQRTARATTGSRLPGHSNYYLGNDPSKWRRSVERFARVCYQGIYRGVDLVYYGRQGQLEYDFVVQPGADPGRIRMEFAGAETARLTPEGDLLLTTAAGDLRQHRPVVYQEVNGRRREVSGRYQMARADSGEVAVGFETGAYDVTRPLIIDPVLSFSTYLGGGGTDLGTDIEVDADGYVYVTGRTASSNFPTANPNQGYVGAGGASTTEGADTFVTKLAPTGDALVYSTYLGGSGLDLANSLSLDADRNVYVSGVTSSFNFPVAAALQPAHGGGANDAFLTKLDSAGLLTFSTYLGGAANDVGWAVLHDGQSSVFLGGMTGSTNFPTLNALQGTISGGVTSAPDDAFVAKLNADGSALQFSTYLGGSLRDSCQGLALDPAGNLCVGGETFSTNFPVTANAKQPASAGRVDTFFTRLTPDGSTRLYATYFGGEYEDRLLGFGVDGQGNVYFAGTTTSRALPVTFGAIRTVYQGGNSDGFLAKLNAAGNAYVYVTYLGGSGYESAYTVAPDAVGNVYVAGFTDSYNFPVASQFHSYSSSLDAFVMRLNPSGQILYSTYLGGMGDNTADYAYGIAADAAGNAYVTGRTYTRYWPLVSPLQSLSGGPSTGDAFVVKLSPLHTPAPTTFQARANTPYEAGLSWVDAGANESGFSLERSTNAINYTVIATLPANTTSYADPGRTPGATYWYRIRAFNPDGYTHYASGAVIMPTDAPVAPTNLTVTAVSSSVLRLTWTDNSANETRFDVYRSSNGGGYALVTYLGVNVTTYDDQSLAPDTLYTYLVYASNSNASTASNPASGRTLPAPPAAPIGLQATAVSTSRIDLTWTDASSNEAGFRLERSLDGTTFTQITETGANATSYSDTALDADTTYTYRARAFNAGGNSGYSSPATAKTFAVPPAAPSNLVVQSVSSTTVQIGWQDNSSTETGFRVRRTAASLPDAENTLPADTTTFVASGLHSNTTYTFEVSAYNAGGSSAPSPSAVALTLPAGPTNLAGQAVSSTRVDLTWTDANTLNPAQIQVERSDDGGATFTRIATTAAGAGSYSDTAAHEDRTHQYRIRAVNATGASSYSDVVAVTTPLDPPAAPDNFSGAYSRTDRRVNLVWQDRSSTETGFQVERSSDGGATWALLATTAAGATGYLDTAWQPDATHRYRVRAVNGAGTSAYAQEITLSMPPAAPTGLTAEPAGAGKILLRWTDNSSREDEFVIERKTGAGAFAEARVVAANATQATDLDLAADTLYTYRVRARNAVDVSDPTNEASARTLPNPPAPPNGLTVRALAPAALTLSWTDNSSNEDGFRVEVWNGSQLSTAGTVGANVTTYTHTGLAANTYYIYQVQAYNAGGLSGSVQTVGVYTLPSAPASLLASTVSQSALDLSWTDTNPNPSGHEIERSTDGVTFSYRALVASGVTTFGDTGLAAGTRYYYRVRAVNGAGPSPYSNTANAMTQLPSPPAAPSNLTGSALSNTQIRLTWRDNSGNESEFRVERSTNGKQFTQMGTVGANATQLTATGLQPNTRYWFRVRAANAGGTSGYSNVIDVRTPKK